MGGGLSYERGTPVAVEVNVGRARAPLTPNPVELMAQGGLVQDLVLTDRAHD